MYVFIENRVDALHDIRRDLQELSPILDRNQRPASAIVHGALQRFDQRTDCLDVARDRQVAEDELARESRHLAERRADGHDQGNVVNPLIWTPMLM